MQRHEPLAGDASRPRPLFLALAVMLALAPFVMADPIGVPTVRVPTQCSDLADNDGDGNMDFPLDLGCTDPLDDDESSEGTPPTPECSDGVDNDGNGARDFPDDNGCRTPLDQDESFDPVLPCGGQEGQAINLQNFEFILTLPNLSCLQPSEGQCSDHADNDGDGRTDFPEDPSCTGPADDDEGGDRQCDDGKDNDGDGRKDMADPKCDGPSDDSEDYVPECSDGFDNDFDGKPDFPHDGGCRSPDDGSEGPDTECNDRMDNDGDGRFDFPDDPACDSPEDRAEDDDPRCGDRVDNDGDGKADYPADPDCTSEWDDDEGMPMECSDGFDNDGNGPADFPSDPGCDSPSDDSESSGACSDGTDNDRDGRTDAADPGCDSPTDDTENGDPQCGDGYDNDGDGRTDYPSDPGCDDAHDETEDPDSDVVPAGGSFSKSSASGPITFTEDYGARCDWSATATDLTVTCYASSSAICENPGFVVWSDSSAVVSTQGQCTSSRLLSASSAGMSYDYQAGNFGFPFTCTAHFDAAATGGGICHAPDP
ncbi:MAG: hypothetical protein QOD77_709 [Thermoplasmata archaeon]|nr:hypothetical protein [Thermoplasmata archaeon]